MPRVSTRAIYDSNIFAVGDATGDLVLRGIADVEANWSSGGFAVGADAEIDRRQYLDFGGQSTTDYAPGRTFRYPPRRATGYFAGGRIGRETEERAESAAPHKPPQQSDERTGGKEG